jgi:PmbA protein
MDILKELQSQAEQAEVINIKDESTSVEFESNRLKTSKVTETRGVAVRVVLNGRLGFAASSDEGAVKKVIANALESAAYGDVVPLQFPESQPAQNVITYDDRIVEMPVARMAEMGQQIIDMVLPVEPDAQVNLTLRRGVQTASIRNQAGADIAFERSPFSIDVEITSVKEDDILILYEGAGKTVWDDTMLESIEALVEKLKLAKQITTIQSGKMPVLFSPVGALVLGLPMMMGLNGKNVFTRISPLVGKIGEIIFDEKITLIDDATLNGRFSSAPYDDEGVVHRRNVFVENGVLKGFYYDLKTAAQAGAQPTGNGSRGLFNPPYPSTTNLLLSNGNTPFKEMIAGIDEGLLVDEVLGLGQGNIISGAFSNPVALGFKIEKGEIVGRVKDVSIAGNIYDVLKHVMAVSRETFWVYNEFNLPYILLPEMNVIAKT